MDFDPLTEATIPTVNEPLLSDITPSLGGGILKEYIEQKDDFFRLQWLIAPGSDIVSAAIEVKKTKW